jgi:hypothetical protein
LRERRCAGLFRSGAREALQAFALCTLRSGLLPSSPAPH